MRRVLQRVTILLQRATERMIITTHKKTLLEAAITLSGDGEATKNGETCCDREKYLPNNH